MGEIISTPIVKVTTGSQNAVYTDEARNEVHQFLNTRRAYVNPKGGLLGSPLVETTTRVLTGLMRG